MNFTTNWRGKQRNQLNLNGSISQFGTMQYSIANYYTDSIPKTEMTKSFADEMLLHNLHMIPNPLQKNLADTLVTAEEKPKKMPQTRISPEKTVTNTSQETANNRSDFYPSLTGISSFISGVFSVLSGGMFQRRPKSPAPQYYDCYDDCFEAPDIWQSSSWEDENKTVRAQEQSSRPAGERRTDAPEMSGDCRAAAAHCEDKLNKVRLLLTNKTALTTPKIKRRPRRAFVEAGTVDETFEDAFSPEDFVRLSNKPHIECYSPCNNSSDQLIEVEAPKIKTETLPIQEAMEIVQALPEVEESDNVDDKKKLEDVEDIKDAKQQIISSCEDKVSQLKALLQNRRKNNLNLNDNISTDSYLEPVKDAKSYKQPKSTKSLQIERPHDKHHKNLNRGTEKRRKSQMQKNIQDDMCFAHEIDEEDCVSSNESSPAIQSNLSDIICRELCSDNTKNHLEKTNTEVIQPTNKTDDYFDEVCGRFRSVSTTDSEDSFQIVFTDSPKACRTRKVSDCDSEDSFIVFEDSPDSCYTSHDVFGDESDSDDEDTESDSDISDSGCGVNCKLSHSLSKSVGDLTDDSLFDEVRQSEDEVDNAVRTVCEEIPAQEIEKEVKEKSIVKNTGLLINETKKFLRKQQPPKKVHFSTDPPKVRVMRVWAFAARQARAGQWEQHALDRSRFKRKIADVDMAVSWVLKPQHRSRVMFQRFMPWWNAQKRQELAEKKKEAERLKEEARIKEEEDRVKNEVRIEDEGNSKEETRIEEDNINKTEFVAQEDKEVSNHVRNVVNDTVDCKNVDSTGVEVNSLAVVKGMESKDLNDSDEKINSKIDTVDVTGNTLIYT